MPSSETREWGDPSAMQMSEHEEFLRLYVATMSEDTVTVQTLVDLGIAEKRAPAVLKALAARGWAKFRTDGSVEPRPPRDAMTRSAAHLE